LTGGSWFAEAVAAPAPSRRSAKRGAAKGRSSKSRSSKRTRAGGQIRSRVAILWILVSALLLAGVVFVNVAVLRLNLQLDEATQQRSKLKAENAVLGSELSSALASPRIQSLARRDLGLVDADVAEIGYIDLGR
jgi:cell division protein FtsL